MRVRSLLLLALAVLLAGGTAMLTRVWLAAQAVSEGGGPAPFLAPKPPQSVLVARADLRRGEILRPEDVIWQIWHDGPIDERYLVLGGPRTPEGFAGWVVKNPIARGEPITEAKIVSPGDRGFLAAVLAPGMRAISVKVTNTSATSGFILPGDRVDLLLSYKVPATSEEAEATRNYEHRAAQTVLRNIRVIGIDQRLDGRQGEAFASPQTATFEVTPKQSEVIALAAEIGNISLALHSLVPAPDEADPPQGLAGSDHGAGGDSPIAVSASFTLDSDISPLLPKRFIARNAPAAVSSGRTDPTPQAAGPEVVTILRGKGSATETVATKP